MIAYADDPVEALARRLPLEVRSSSSPMRGTTDSFTVRSVCPSAVSTISHSMGAREGISKRVEGGGGLTP